MSNVGQKRTAKRFAVLLSVLCMACLLLLGAVVPRAAFAAPGADSLGTTGSVQGWKLATNTNLTFTEEKDDSGDSWANFAESEKSTTNVDVIYNTEGFDVSQPVEFKVKIHSMPNNGGSTGRWIGFFFCRNLTQDKLDVGTGNMLTVDIQSTAANPWVRSRVGSTELKPGAYLGSVPDGYITIKVEFGEENTTVTIGSGSDTVYIGTTTSITRSWFSEGDGSGKCYINSRFHYGSDATGDLFDVSYSAVKNGVPIHYTVGEETTTQKIAEDATTLTLPAAPDMPAGQTFGAWRAPDGKMYKAGDTYPFADGATKETTFTAVPSASDAVVSLEYDTVVWSGEKKEPSVTVTLGDVTIDSSNYDVAYENNTAVGTGKVTVTFKNGYYGSATAEFAITKIQENTTGEDVSLTLEEATFEKMKILGGDYVYTIKDSEGNAVTEQTQIAAGLYTVTAVLNTDTKTTTVTYLVAVGKTLENVEGEDISLTFEEATYAKMTVLGSDYVYTVTDSQGGTVTEGTALAAGVYTVKAVKETATQIRTVTYTVTIAQPVEEDPSDDPTPPPEDPNKNQGEEQGTGCSSSVSGGAFAVFAIPALAVCAVLIAKRKNSIRK